MKIKYQSQRQCQELGSSLLLVVDKLTQGSRRSQLRAVAQGRKNPLWMGLPGRLHQTRKIARLSQRQVGLRAGLSSAVLSRTECGLQVPLIESVERLAAGLGVSVCWLAYGHQGNEPFQKKKPRSPLPPDDPEPLAGGSVFLGRFKDCGTRVRLIREQLGLSLRELARVATERIDELKLAEPRVVSYQAVLYTETGETVPQLDTIEYIAMALEVAPAWLAFGDEEPLDHVRNMDQVP